MAFASGSPAVLLHRDRQFFARMTIGLALVIVLGFGQFAALGRVDYRHVPLWFHVHGALMLSWLTLAVVQTQLAARLSGPALALHRRMGWLALVYIVAIPLVGGMTLRSALGGQLIPPFFTPAYFLALNACFLLGFPALILLAVLRRRETAWHARLILAAQLEFRQFAHEIGAMIEQPGHGMHHARRRAQSLAGQGDAGGVFLRPGFLDTARQVESGAHLVRKDQCLAIQTLDDSGIDVACVLHGEIG